MAESKRTLCLSIGIWVAAASVVAGAARAQVIEFEPPTEIVIDESRLIVTFADGVGVERAREIVAGAGGEVERDNFRAPVAWALFDAIPEAEPILALRNDDRIQSLSVLPPAAAGGVWVTLPDGERVVASFSTHALRVEMPPATAEEDATAVVATYFPDLPVRVEKYPNELIVRLPEESDDVVAAIEAHPDVQYVTYVSADVPEITE